MAEKLRVGMIVVVQGGMGNNNLVVEEVGVDYFVARFLTGTKHQRRFDMAEYLDTALPALDQNQP